MNGPASDPDRATMEAARWLVALADDPDDSDLRARIEAWRAADPDNEAAWRDTTFVHDLMADARAGDTVARPARVRGRPRDSRRPLRHRIVAAALTAVAAALLLILGPGLVLRLQADEITGAAEVRLVDLDDGSRVFLGADSAIAWRASAAGRGLRLLKGEAFFEVARDPLRPFTVVARDVDVTVLGTSFDVRLGRDGAEVAVATGMVRVANAGEDPAAGVRLEAGDWVRLGERGSVERGIIRPDEVAPWLQGQIVARDRPMTDVVDELRRYYAGTIVLAGDSLRGRRVTGVYNLGDPKAALSAIVGAHGGSVRQVSPWLLVARGS